MEIPFSHNPLPDADNWIRILTISSQSNLGGICCTLTNQPIGSEHVCLSYTWGTDEASHPVRINNQTLLVKNNLHVFLQETVRRKELVDTPLWIDAICINQNDIPEKNKQVSRMGDIYRTAKKVLVWLGSGDKAVEEAIRHMKAYGESPLVDSDDEDSPTSEMVEGFAVNTQEADYNGTPVRIYWDNFDVVATLPYWYRMWIVQEVLLASDIEIWYGSQGMDAGILQEYCNFINGRAGPPGCSPYIGNSKIIRSSCGWLLNKVFSRAQLPPSSTIVQFQLAFTNLNQQLCFDRRDLVYALRALDPDLQEIPVNYSEDAVLLFPKIFGSSVATGQPVPFGLSMIFRFDFDMEKVIRLTQDALPGKTWRVEIDDIGIVKTRDSSTTEICHVVDWSALRFKSRPSGTKFDDGEGTVTQTISPADNTAMSIQLQPGDMVVRSRWGDILFVYRIQDQRLKAECVTQLAALKLDTVPEYKQVAERISDYTFVSAFAMHWTTIKNPRPAADYLNIGVHSSLSRNVLEEFHNSHVRFEGSNLHLAFTWRCLLRFWQLKDRGLLNYNSKSTRGIGSWAEEAEKARLLQSS